MTGVTEFLLTGMTLHACQHQALLVFFTINCNGAPISVSQYLISPLIQHLHMAGAHSFSRKDAAFCILWQLWLWCIASIAMVVPDGDRDKQDENDQPRNDFTTVVHCYSSISTGGLD